MKGKVKTLTEETFEFKWNNDTIVQETQGIIVYEFTEKGELKNKTISSVDYKNAIKFSQYENGRAMRFDRIMSNADDINKDSIKLFIVDHKNERLVTWSNYNHDYARTDTTLIRYTGDEINITPLSDFRKLEITEIHDRRGNLIRETRSLRGRRVFECDWIYNEDDLLVNENGTQIGGFSIDKYSFFYEYEDFDKSGNWRKKIVKMKEMEYDENKDKITHKIIVRQIRYY